MKRILLAAALAFCAFPAVAQAQNLTGVWKGKVHHQAAALPEDITPETRKQVEAIIATIKKLRVTMTLRANKTYVAVVTSASTKMQQNEGTWVRKGNTLWITSTKTNGKKSKPLKQAIAISKDGKTLSLALPDKGLGAGKIVFTR